MAHYCSSAGKFAGFDEPNVEEGSDDIEGNTISLDFTVSRPCAECGGEYSTYEGSIVEEFDVESNHTCAPDSTEVTEEEDDDEDDEESYDFEVSSVDYEAESYVQTHDRKGKRITNPRYAKTLFRVTAIVTVHCNKCNDEFDIILTEDGIAASSFDTESH